MNKKLNENCLNIMKLEWGEIYVAIFSILIFWK